jgi:DNA-binding MarR family transcriptional regulator
MLRDVSTVDRRTQRDPATASSPSDRPTSAARTATELTTILAGLGRDATTRVRRAIRPLNLGAQQYLVLSQLRDLGSTSQAELAAALALDPSNLASTIAELVDRRLVDRCRDDIDRRRYAIGISTAGQALLDRADQTIAVTELELLKPLNNRQRDELLTLLRRVADGVDLCPAASDDSCTE